ncbi:MAG: hypothetical protein M1829_000024 [Trizodia sp. TS-e1964]|nr:MAG: hypothetical protein M1829_000024 [Trizodia sp. TS-e1964]
MNGSFSFIPPRDAHALWYRPAGSSTRPRGQASNRTPNSQGAEVDFPTQAEQAGRLGVAYGNHATVTSITRLRAEEIFIRGRVQNIQNFGSTWIRPPGVTKTLQLMRDEAAEREELQAAYLEAQAEAMDFAGGEVTADGEGGALPGPAPGPATTRGATPAPDAAPTPDPMEGVQRDLDDDIPDADNGDMDMGYYEDDDDSADESPMQSGPGSDQQPDLRRAAAVPTPTVSTPDITLPRPSADDEDDLDDAIPDADSYQHTDTDVEDDDTDDDMPERSQNGIPSFVPIRMPSSASQIAAGTASRQADSPAVTTPVSATHHAPPTRNTRATSGGSPPAANGSAASTRLLGRFVSPPRSPLERGQSSENDPRGSRRVRGRGYMQSHTQRGGTSVQRGGFRFPEN